MDRTERLLDLVALLLDAAEPVPFAELREAFPEDYGGAREAAERKLERDKADLVALGVPLEYVPPDSEGRERELGGYRIDRRAFFLPDPGLHPDEVAALFAAGSAALATRAFPFSADLQHALRKIALAGRESPPSDAAARHLLIVRPGPSGRDGRLQALADAVARRKRVHLVYRAPPPFSGAAQAERTERDVDPYGLAFRGGAWRLVGYCSLRRAQRTFVVDRIESLHVNDAKPGTPDFEVPQNFDAGAAAGRRPWQWGPGPAQEVVLRFAAGSERLAERAFEAREGAEARVAATLPEGLLPEVLAHGDRLWIESPEPLRERAVAILRKLEARLTEGPSRGADDAPASSADPAPPPGAQTARLPPAPSGGAEAGDRRERLRKLLLVVPAVLRRPRIPLPELARELGLEVGQLRADIEMLALVGRPPFSPDDMIEIDVDERDRVTVTLDGSFSSPPRLTALEALALATAAEEVASADPAVVSALAKLTATLPAAARSLYAGLARRVIAASPAPRGTEPLLAALRTAAEARREVALDYDKEGNGATVERLLEPHVVLDHGGRWYVVGRDVERNAERTFRIDRVGRVRETGRTFPDAGPVDPARFERAQLFFPSGAEVPVTFRFSPAAAAWAEARHGALARRLPDGAVEVTVEAAGTAWAVSLALSLAGEAEIVAPPFVRAALRDAVHRALARYLPRRPP